MDLATVIGLTLSFLGLMGGYMLENKFNPGAIAPFFLPSPLMIIFGGTFGAAFVSFPMKQVMGALTATKAALFTKELEAGPTIVLFSRLAEKARREGLLSLEEEEASLDDDFIKKGIQLVVDGTDPELLTAVMEIEITQMENRHYGHAQVFEAMGGYAPTMGIIGTVMGLVTVLSEASGDPAALLHGVAVAFIATLYGVMTANVLWLPIAQKLKVRSEEEATVRRIMLEGLLSVQAGENPRVIQEKLHGFLPPKMRKALVEGEGAEGSRSRAEAAA